jgi:hypothetical protein
VAFADLEHLEIPELNPTVHDWLDRLYKLMKAFREAQEAFEGDEFGHGSRFVGKSYRCATTCTSSGTPIQRLSRGSMSFSNVSSVHTPERMGRYCS